MPQQMVDPVLVPEHLTVVRCYEFMAILFACVLRASCLPRKGLCKLYGAISWLYCDPAVMALGSSRSGGPQGCQSLGQCEDGSCRLRQLSSRKALLHKHALSGRVSAVDVCMFAQDVAVEVSGILAHAHADGQPGCVCRERTGSNECKMRRTHCSRQNLPSKVLPFVMSSLVSLKCSATPGKAAAFEKKPIPGFPGSSNKVEGVLPRVLPGGRTFCQGL